MSSSAEVVFYPCLEWLESARDAVMGTDTTYLAADSQTFEFIGGSGASLVLVTTSGSLMNNIRIDEDIKELPTLFELPPDSIKTDAEGGIVSASNSLKINPIEAQNLIGRTVFMLRGTDKDLLGVATEKGRGITPKSLRERTTEIFFSGGTAVDWHIAVGSGAELTFQEGSGFGYWSGGSNCFGAIGMDSNGDKLDFISTSAELFSKDRGELENPASTPTDFPLLMGSEGEDSLLSSWSYDERQFNTNSTNKDVAKVLVTFREPWIDVQIAEFTTFNIPDGYKYDQVYIYTSGPDGDMVAFAAQLGEPTDRQLGRILISAEVANILII